MHEFLLYRVLYNNYGHLQQKHYNGRIKLISLASYTSGTFGVVYKATLDDQLVAVKMAQSKLETFALCTGTRVYNFTFFTSHTDLSSKHDLRSLLNESILMKDFDHPNIVGLLGVCFDTPDGKPYLILPFMANGNIRDYLKNRRIQPTNTATLPKVCC